MTDIPAPGSEWLLPVTLKHVSRNQKTAVTFFGFEHDESEVLIPLSVNTLIPASRLADLEAEVARWQQLYADTWYDLTKAEMEVERLSGVIGNLNMDRMKMHGWLQDIEPHLDALICYASNMDEHPPNRTVKDVREYLNSKD